VPIGIRPVCIADDVLWWRSGAVATSEAASAGVGRRGKTAVWAQERRGRGGGIER
jgi:hypothetical protein